MRNNGHGYAQHLSLLNPYGWSLSSGIYGGNWLNFFGGKCKRWPRIGRLTGIFQISNVFGVKFVDALPIQNFHDLFEFVFTDVPT